MASNLWSQIFDGLLNPDQWLFSSDATTNAAVKIVHEFSRLDSKIKWPETRKRHIVHEQQGGINTNTQQMFRKQVETINKFLGNEVSSLLPYSALTQHPLSSCTC